MNEKWDDVQELPFNDSEYSTGHTALSPDGKTLYFSSDMPGGSGESDLYKVAINEDGTFGEPENLGSGINTPGRENFPYIDSEGTLYFSSDGHLGIGGLDVFYAKAEGSSTGLSKEISDLFPDTFESSEIGEIPKGWHVGNIEDIAEKVSDKYKREEDWSNEKLIDLSRMPSNSIALNSHGKGEELSTSVCKFQKYDFLFGSIRPYFYKAGVCPFNGVSNTSVFILRAKNDFDREFMYFYSSSEKTFERSVQYSDGTKMPIIKWNDFKEFKFALPNKELRKNFSSITRPIVDKIILNIEEQETLSNLRDSLLPKLIAGEIKIPDVEELIEEVSIK